MSPIDQFLEKLKASLLSGRFAKLTLSQPSGAQPELRNLYGRVIELRGERVVSLIWHYARRDVTKNLSFDAAIREVGGLLGKTLERARLFTLDGDWQLRCEDGRAAQMKRMKPAFTIAPSTEHDRAKVNAFAEQNPAFLQALGVTNAKGEARPGMADKLRQIERFTELLGHLVDKSPLGERRELRVLDMGAGKGYLTFATHEFLRQRGVEVEIIGVEIREDLVALTNEVARKTKAIGLRFVRGAIGEYQTPESLDLLIALHACNTATDDAIFQGIRAGASLIIAAPCCHQEIRPQIKAPGVLRDVLRHGILLEREAEIVTDAIRALLLEIAGYETNVFEFISLEHTGKNLMIAGSKRPNPVDPAPLRKRLRALFEFYGLREQRLAQLMGELTAD